MKIFSPIGEGTVNDHSLLTVIKEIPLVTEVELPLKKLCSLAKRYLWETESKELEKSRKTETT